MGKTPPKNKYRVVEAVLQASFRLLKSKITPDVINFAKSVKTSDIIADPKKAEALELSDTISDNKRMIEHIKEEIVSYGIPINFEGI